MPVYVYEVVRDDAPDGLPGCRFEVVQGMTEPALTAHPVTGQPVRRVVQPAALAGMHSDLKTAGKLDEKNLARHGFAKYIKVGDETYEKMVGDGPDRLSAEDLQKRGG
ncbi:MAG: FmdB family transcriptional regulator [Planctomycetota bacterium]